MSASLGADTRRVDLVAEGLRGHSGDIQDLRCMAQRAVAELRTVWAGPDFERIAQRWEQEAGPRLADVATALTAMACALRAQAEEQRQASGNTGGPSVPARSGGTPGGVAGAGGGGGGGGGASWDGKETEVDDLDPDDLDLRRQSFVDSVKDNVKVNLAGAEVGADASLISREGGDENALYELSVGTVEAKAGSHLDIDAHGNLVASADVSAAAYLVHAVGKVHRGNDFANGTLGGTASVGAEAEGEVSGSIGRDGAEGHVGAEVFAGAKVEADVGGTLAGVRAEAGVEVSYGVGVHADVDAELSATKFGVSLDVGATLGVGTGLKLEVNINPQEVVANVGHAAEEISEAAEAVGDQVASAGNEVAKFFHW